MPPNASRTIAGTVVQLADDSMALAEWQVWGRR